METEIHSILANIWFVFVVLMLLLYVVLDGFDLGVGVLSLFAGNPRHSVVMMASLESIWDANETWLVLLGGSLFGAFPAVFATVLHGLYVPVMLMLFALIFRGFAFEFRHHVHNASLWNQLFGYSSLLASLAQGLAFGGLIGSWPAPPGTSLVWDWLSPFSILVAIGVVAGYALLGATYLIIKTEGALQRSSIRQAYLAAVLQILILMAVIVWIPVFNPYFAERCTSRDSGRFVAFFLVLALLAFTMLLVALRRRHEVGGFFWSVIMAMSAFIAVVIGYYPYMVPGSMTFVAAAASDKTLVFMLLGIGFLIPVMLIYSGYQYLVFRGKIRTEEMWHGRP